MIQTEKNLMRLFKAFQIIKDNPDFSDKECFVYLTMLTLPDGVKSEEIHIALNQRKPFMDKFMAKLIDKKLWPIPIDMGKPEPVKPQEQPKPVPPPQPKPLRPTCEGCGLEGTIDGTKANISGIILFEEGPEGATRVLCSTCRCRAINPVHGVESEGQGEEDETLD
jgi:hypothetical protein